MENINITKLNYDSIKYFLCVAKAGSISRAAASLGISQSALSQSMKSLEQSLGLALFARNTRGIILTEEGKVLYTRALGASEQLQRAVVETLRCKEFKGMATFKIAASSSLVSAVIAPNILALQKKFPNLSLEFCKLAGETEVVNDLQLGKYDLAIFKADRDFVVKEVEMQKLCERTYVVVYNPAYFQLPDEIKLEELEKYPLVMKERSGKNENSWMMVTAGKFICCRNDNQCLEMIKNGAGVGIYPKELAERAGLKIAKVDGYKPTKRLVNMCYLGSNQIAKDFAKALVACKNN